VNITADVKAYVVNALKTLYATMTIDSFGIAPEALMIRGDPSQATVVEYIDGSTTGTQSVSFYARSKNPDTALSALDAIRVLLDQPEIALTGVLCIKVMPKTLPALVAKEDTGESVYTFTVDVEYNGKNEK
jgi:hypothetical protein